MGNILKNYYENRYAEDRNINSIEVIPYKKHPINRYETCVKYFTDNFKGGSILEIGSGSGIIANSILTNNNKVTKYLASDLSDNRLIAIRKNILDKRLEVQNIDAENFDFNNLEKFDAIIMVAIIEHVVDPITTMKNLKSALKPGGIIYIDTPNIADYGCRFKLLKGKFPSTASKNEGLLGHDNKDVTLFDEGHLHYFTYKSLSQMLTKYCGYSETQKYYFPVGRLFLGKAIHYNLAKMWPELFSMLVLIAK